MTSRGSVDVTGGGSSTSDADLEKNAPDSAVSRADGLAHGEEDKGFDAGVKRQGKDRDGALAPNAGAVADGHEDDEHEDGESDHEPNVLDRVLSRISTRSNFDPGPPPDGGLQAWTQCFVGHLVIFNSWGWINSFGTFQAYYTHTLHRTPSEVSWIGSLNVFLLFFVGTFTGRLTDAGYFRLIFTCGSLLLVVGIFMTSLCTTYWQLLLAQGLCMGVAHGMIFCPILAVLSTYFVKKRAIALGIAACGSATGGLVFPSMVRQLLPSAGFRWTVCCIGFVQVATMLLANALAKPRVKPRRTGPIVDWSAFKDLEYTFYAAGAYFNFWGVYFAFFYVAAFSRSVLHPPLSYPDSLNMLLLLNGIGIIGRLAPNYFADRLGPVNVFIPNSIIASIILFGFIAVDSPTGLYVWVVFYGIAAGGIQSLFPAALSSLTTDLRKIGVRMGMVFTIVSFAVLTGPPISGAIVDSPAGYTGAQAFAGSSIAVGCGFLIAAKMAKMRKTGLGWKSKV